MLLTFLDVDSQFLMEEGPRQRDRHFLSAIHTLQQLKTTFTPVQKLAVVGDMFKAITESREGVTWSMDTLLPVCMYVVVRARVLQLGAELAMLQELMEDFLFQVDLVREKIFLSFLIRIISGRAGYHADHLAGCLSSDAQREHLHQLTSWDSEIPHNMLVKCIFLI